MVNPDKASVEQEYHAATVHRAIQVLTPVLARAPRGRTPSARVFADSAPLPDGDLKQRELRLLSWNIERLVSAHRFKPYRKLEQSFGFNLLDAVPINEIRNALQSVELSGADHERLSRFRNRRWPQVTSESDESTGE